jgi:hypothetical protein
MFRHFILPVLGLCLFGCHTAPKAVEDDSKIQGKVAEAFNRLKSDGKLTGLSANDSGQMSVFGVKNGDRVNIYLFSFKNFSPKCGRVFAVDVIAGSRHPELAYFFCCDDNPPALIGAFYNQGGKWAVIQNQTLQQ